MRPGPTATTSPSCGRSCAVSGITSPDAVVCSASRGRKTMRSSSGLMETDTADLPFTCWLTYTLRINPTRQTPYVVAGAEGQGCELNASRGNVPHPIERGLLPGQGS